MTNAKVQQSVNRPTPPPPPPGFTRPTVTVEPEPAPRSNAGGTGRSTTAGKRKVTFKQVLQGIGNLAILILTFPVRILTFLTTSPGSAIPLGCAVIYFWLLSTEGYWQATDLSLPSFLPKFFVDDDATFSYLFVAIWTFRFWIAGIFSTAINILQALHLRERDVDQAKAEYERYARYTVPQANANGLEVAEELRQDYKKHGMKGRRIRKFGIIVAYVIDISIAAYNFPLSGLSSFFYFVINIAWMFASVFGLELFINYFMNAIAPIKRPPKTEVIK